MNRSTAYPPRCLPAARILLVALPLVLAALVAGAGGGRAAAADTPPPATRDHDRGRWFRHVCSLPGVRAAWCGAQVVTSAGGDPLASSTPPSGAMTPAAFHTAYSLPADSLSGTPTIAIVDAYDDPSIEADLTAYSQQFGLPPCTTANGCFKKVDQNGGTSYPSGTSWHLEIALDVEIAHAICQNCKLLLVEASSNSLADLGTAVNTAVALGANVVSNSYGGGEFSSETIYESLYYQHPGVAITASAGDSGYGVEFPAASRYVTAVGGTTLSLNADGTYAGETVWDGTGSGCSRYVAKPSWQTDGGCTKRTVADVAADADPNSGAAIYDSVGASGGRGWYQVGGTSLSAPLIGAVYALAGAANVNDGSAPYGQPALLNDVVAGSNGTCAPSYLCTAGAGFDGPTGLGTPHGLGAFGGAAPSPDFALSVSPASRTVTQGAQAAYTVTVAPANGFAAPVTLATGGLPAGASASFAPNPATSGSTLTVSTTASLAVGTYPFTITGTSGGLTHTAAATLVVQAAATPDFALAVSPPSQTVTAGAQTSYAVTLTTTGGFASQVTLAATGLPAGAAGSFDPNPPAATSTLTVTTSSGLAAGSYPFTITGTSGSLVHSASATLVVQAGGATLTVSPTSARRGTNVTVTWSGVAAPTPTDWVGIFKPGAPNTSSLSSIYDSSCRRNRTGSARSAGSCSFRLPKKAGTYELRLMANGGFTPIVTGVTVVAT